MTSRDPRTLHDVFQEIRQGTPGAVEAAFPRIYDALLELADGYMRRERPQHTLQPTALVHEAYLRLQKDQNLQPADRNQFLAIAAGAMRRALVDHARSKQAHKRGGDWQRVTLNEEITGKEEEVMDIVALDEMLERLGEHHERMCRVVEFKFFGGLNATEIGELLGVSARTVGEDWAVAKMWLRREFEGNDDKIDD